MSENIELRTFQSATANDNDIEEYHEINHEEVLETTFQSSFPKTLNEYDFFSKHDVKIERKDSRRKKKGKKKDKTSNLMDMITCELASVAVPIKENVISFVETTVEQRSSYLETTPRSHVVLRRHSHYDSEQGWEQSNAVDLSPTFPRVLENITTHINSLPVQYIRPTKYDELIADMDTKGKLAEKFLNIELKDVNFKVHHQFSLEKLLSVKLIDFYNEYNNINSTIKNLLSEIKINRETRDNLKEELMKISPNKKEDLRFDQTVRKYTGNLLELKEKYLEKLQIKKEIIHKMGSLWADIEMLREKTGHTYTSVILSLSKKSMKEEDYDIEWNEAFNVEFSDMLDKLEYEYVSKYIEYKEVKYTQNLDDSAKRRVSKPKLQIDEETLNDDVEELVNRIVTKDKLDIHLINDGKILSNFSTTENSNAYYFEIYVDDTFVCKSDIFTCIGNEIDSITFAESMSLQILPNNSALTIVLSENDREAASLKINIPGIRHKTNGNDEFLKRKFVNNDIIAPNDKHIGCGHSIKQIAAENEVRLKSSNMFKGNLYTACEVNIKLEWNEKIDQDKTETIINSLETGRKIKRLLHGIDKLTTDTLTDIIGKLYNLDVSNNEAVLNKLRDLCKLEVGVDDTFSIDENSPEFIRLKLLHLRNNGGMNHVENKQIPIHASQISTEQLNCLQKSAENDIDVQYFHDKDVEMDPIELQRFIGAKYLQKLNSNMLKNLNEHLLRKTHKDVVRDFKDLSLRGLFSNQNKLILSNISSSAKQQLLSEALGQEQEIRVNVLRAFNLPDRSSVEEGDGDQIAGFKVHPLRPYVRVSYNGASAQTAPAIGCHPSWSQTVKISARSSPLSNIQINVFDEYKEHIPDSDEDRVHYRFASRWLGGLQIPLHTVLSLGGFRGTFKLTTPPMYFDYELVKSKENVQSIVPAITQLMTKEISFLSVHITTSLSHLGGLHGYNQPIPNSEDYLISHVNAFVTEYTNDFPSRNISLTFIDSSGRNKCVTQFLQPIPLPDYECFPKNPKMRSESALSKSSGSKSSSSKGRRESERDSYQSGEERESLYSTMSWRNGESQLEKVMCGIARYVSLIPTYEVCESHTVTLLGLELLKILHGSPLDHTVLLASYFLYLGIRCWVAIGLGLPRGQSSYVLTKHEVSSQRPLLLNEQPRNRGLLGGGGGGGGGGWLVHDAVRGDSTPLRDVGCPLNTVDYVFDNENIWVNVQSSLDCESVSFDFTRSSDWQPVFDKSVFVMKQPVLTDPALYRAACDVDRLRAALDSKIREKVQKWRSHTKTIWNRYCSSLLRETLPHWEYWTFNPSEPKPGLGQRLKQLMATYKMFGFPLNLPYVNTKSVLATVKATGVHCSSDPNAEFGLAVEVCAYPNNVLSVWVFLACITRI